MIRHAAILAVCGAAFFSGAAGADKDSDLRKLRERIDTLQRDLTKNEETRTEAADALKTSEESISDVNRKLVGLNQAQSTISKSLAELGRQIAANRANAAQQQQLLERMIRHQYMYGSTDGLRLLLDGKDVSEAERQMRYLGYVSRTRAGLISQLKRNAASLSELEAAARAQQQELNANAEEQKRARATLQAERAARQKVFTRVKADIAKGRREIGRLKRDEERLSKLIEELTRALAKKREERKERKPPGIQQKGEPVESVADATLSGYAFATLRGKLKLPVRGELQGRFGSPREEGSKWKGLFIKAPSGSPVHAIADGEVVHDKWVRGMGNLLILDHGNGYLSVYANNESLLKQAGEKVKSGETVATVGSTGGALESGVYFELRHEGDPIDPMKWVSK